MNLDPAFLTATFWYSKFQSALSDKDFAVAEEYFKRFQYWKRRGHLNDYLEELCQEKEFDNGRK